MAQPLTLMVHGSALGKTGQRFVVRSHGKVIQEVPFFRVSEIVIPNRAASVSADALFEAVQRGIRVSFLGTTGTPYAVISSSALVATVETRREQLAALHDGRAVTFARNVVVGKLRNQARLLKYFGKYAAETDKPLAGELAEITAEIEAAADVAQRVDGARIADIREELMGYEGAGARSYWGGVKALVGGVELFPGRTGRGASDPINAVLNYGYGVLMQAVWGAVMNAGLEPFGGFLHTDRSGKPSLVLDLMEEFRAPLVDRPVIAACRRGEKIRVENGRLDEDTRRLVADRVLQRLAADARFGGRRVSLRSIIQAQVRSLAGFVRGREAYRPFAFQW